MDKQPPPCTDVSWVMRHNLDELLMTHRMSHSYFIRNLCFPCGLPNKKTISPAVLCVGVKT